MCDVLGARHSGHSFCARMTPSKHLQRYVSTWTDPHLETAVVVPRLAVPEKFTNIDFIFFCVGLPKGQLIMPRKLTPAFRAGQSATPSASWESTFIL